MCLSPLPAASRAEDVPPPGSRGALRGDTRACIYRILSFGILHLESVSSWKLSWGVFCGGTRMDRQAFGKLAFVAHRVPRTSEGVPRLVQMIAQIERPSAVLNSTDPWRTR